MRCFGDDWCWCLWDLPLPSSSKSSHDHRLQRAISANHCQMLFGRCPITMLCFCPAGASQTGTRDSWLRALRWILLRLSALDGPVALLRLEFSSSPFDSDRLGQVKSLCQELNQHLGRLLYLSASLPEHLQSRLARRVGLLDHRNIGDVMAVLGVVEQALKTGDPLPEVLPTPLLKRCMEYWQTHQIDIPLTKELIRDENYRRFCVAVSSYLKFLAAVDDLVLVLKGTLGESHIVNRELMHDGDV